MRLRSFPKEDFTFSSRFSSFDDDDERFNEMQPIIHSSRI